MNSRTVTTNQSGVNHRLQAVVRKHLQTGFRRPFAAHSVAAFERADAWLQRQGAPLILDSFCGSGESSRELARQFPGHAVVGIDKSAHRLGRHPGQVSEAANYLLVQADTDDFWRLAQAAGWRPERHYLLYPNPWPKAAHLQRRCHGSPLFPTLLRLGGRLELRSNWRLYVEEFCAALAVADHGAVEPERCRPEPPISAFERKYHAAGQPLWRCVAHLRGRCGDG